MTGTTPEQGQVIAPALTDLKTLRAYSGRYWVIAAPGSDGRIRAIENLRSRSLWDGELALPANLADRLRANPRKPVAFDTAGPQPGERVRALARWTALDQ